MTIDRRTLFTATGAAIAAVAVDRVLPATASVPPAPTLAELIAAAPNGTAEAPTVIDGAGAVFVSEQTVRISGRSWLVLRNFTLQANTDGSAEAPYASGGTTINWPRNRSHIRIDGGTSEAAYVAALEAQHGVDIDDGASFVTVRRCRISDVYGDVCYVRANDVLVEDVTGSRTGRQGIALTNASRVTLRRVALDNIRRSMVDLETNTATNSLQDVLIEDCTFYRARLLGIACKGQGSNVGRITVRRNTFTKVGTPPISFETPSNARRGPVTIEDNTFAIEGSPRAGFEFRRIDGLVFRRNAATAPANRQMTAVLLNDCHSANVGTTTLAGFLNDVLVV